jgi:hypothetical protein
VAPGAAKRTALEKHRRADTGTIVQGIFLDFENGALDHIASRVLAQKNI